MCVTRTICYVSSVYDKESLYFKYSSSMLRSKDAKQVNIFIVLRAHLVNSLRCIVS